MNNSGMRMTLALGLLALVGAPAQAERYLVEPITDSADAAEEQGFSQAELDQMLAPIALYPDSLLSQVLIAATYPLEIVQAARWSRQNPHLEGEAAVEAVADFDWDPSVKALVAFPDLLAQMDEDLQWTRSLGDAMLYQEEQVMDSVQFLRARADAAGHLETNEYARVIREQETIIIEPAQTRVVHVPYYDPHVVYGPWWRPAYPPVYWTAPAYYHYGYPGFYWSSGIHVSSGFFFSSFYWPHRSVVIVHTPRFHHPHRHHSARHHFTPGQRWKHNPRHRRGVDYRHRDVRQRFDQPRLRAGPVTRWPLESGAARTERGTHDRRSRGPGRDGRTRESNFAGRPGSEGRERIAAFGQSGADSQRRDRAPGTSDSDDDTSSSARTGSETRLSAGPRTLRPGVTDTDERLRSARESAATRHGSAAPQRSTSRGTAPSRQSATPAQRATTPSRLSATPTQRSTIPSRQSTAAPPRATGPSRSSIAPPQRSAAPSSRAATPVQRTARPAPAARASSSSSATAPAPAQRSRATNRGGGSESQSAPASRREARGSNSPRGGSGRLGRRTE